MPNETRILQTLRQNLVQGRFAPGARLQPEKLRMQFDCSASLIRECLFRLSFEGLVDFREQRGFRMPLPSPELQHQLTHMRILLESEGASLSVQNGSVAWEAQLSAAHHKLSHIEMRVKSLNNRSDLVDLWNAAELEFHETLIGACGSETLIQTHQRIYFQFRQQLTILDRQFMHVDENVAQHKAILDAALDRDEPRLRQGIHDHLSRNMMHRDAA